MTTRDIETATEPIPAANPDNASTPPRSPSDTASCRTLGTDGNLTTSDATAGAVVSDGGVGDAVRLGDAPECPHATVVILHDYGRRDFGFGAGTEGWEVIDVRCADCGERDVDPGCADEVREECA